jgi:hypothetical protein
MVALLLGVLTAEAGQIFYLDTASSNLMAMDTRTLVEGVLAPAPREALLMNAMGMAYVDSTGEIWMYGPTGGLTSHNYLAFAVPLLRVSWVSAGGSYDVSALSTSGAWNPGDLPVAFDYRSLNVIYFTSVLMPLGISVNGADWCEECQAILALDYSGDFYAIDPTAGSVLWRGFTPRFVEAELAYDRDSRVLWGIDQGGWRVGFDSTTLEEVAYLPGAGPAGFVYEGGAGSIDDVGPQTPELLVTGECPGTVYVTAVDATPGAHVQFASGTRLGRRAVRSGPCAGVAGGLANPVPRYDLVAGASGIASITFQATAPMCGALAIQALDVGSCQTTSVRYVPDPVVP